MGARRDARHRLASTCSPPRCRSSDDRLVGDAAWALGEILAARAEATAARAGAIVDRWLYLGKHGGWAGSINGTAALARLLWALPRAARDDAARRPRRAALLALAFHKSRLVRINVAHALASLTGDEDATKALAPAPARRRQPARPHRRRRARSPASAARKATAALKAAADARRAIRLVRAAAKTAAAAAPLPARSEWRTFYVVDPSADDAPVRQEPYFVHTPDDLVWASYTDARGELNSEHIPPGDAVVWAASRETEY